jgi:hypothetical protein
MKRIIFGIVLVTLTSILMSCGGPASNVSNTSTNTGASGTGGESPTDAYKKLYAAVKAKDNEAIKSVMTKGSLDFAKANAGRTNQTLEQILANGFTATTFSPTLPQIRDERINGDMGAVEVFNSKDNRWEDLPFIREDGTWKLAIGEAWFGKFTSPGKGQAAKEAEAANAMSNNMVPVSPNVNGNFRGAPMAPGSVPSPK